jgi:CBS domain-containing protein/SAM-dependent methyltransferase
MSYLVRDVMTMYGPETNGRETVRDVAEIIARTGASAVPIIDTNGRVRGILRAQDIVISLGRGDDPAATAAAEIARDTVTIGPGATLAEASELLLEHQGIAVVVDDGAPTGLVELGQIEKFGEAVAALGPAAGHLITEVSSKDTPGAHRYRGMTLMSGVSAVQCIRNALTAAGKESVSSLLDFPSGYGRILRVLKAAFPHAKLAAGDIDRHAVDFCARTFGAAPIYSAERPEDVSIDDSFDVLWCGSLLTHVNSDRWPGFLSLFRRSLSSDGVLVFTTCGPRLRAEPILRRFALQDEQIETVLRGYDQDGFGYAGYPGTDNYGITLASPDWVRGQLRAAGLRLVTYMEAGWDAPAPRQDVFACVPE